MIEFIITSISAFQPYIISGEVAHPEKKITFPSILLEI